MLHVLKNPDIMHMASKSMCNMHRESKMLSRRLLKEPGSLVLPFHRLCKVLCCQALLPEQPRLMAPVTGAIPPAVCRGQLAAAADSIGRVLLVDSASLAVLRIWRAYRNAQLAWLLLPSQCADSQPGPAAQPVPASGPHAPTGPTGSRHRLQLALVLYAPRRGVVEVWQVERGPCLLRLTVSQDASLLTPSCLGGTHSQGVGAERWRLQRQCWLLDWAAGEVLDVAAAVAEARPGG